LVFKNKELTQQAHDHFIIIPELSKATVYVAVSPSELDKTKSRNLIGGIRVKGILEILCKNPSDGL
jgi:hypothetical protein